MISPFSKGVFGVGLGELILLFGMETMLRGRFFWVAWGEEVWLFLKVGRLGFFSVFQKKNSLVVWDGVHIFFPPWFFS